MAAHSTDNYLVGHSADLNRTSPFDYMFLVFFSSSLYQQYMLKESAHFLSSLERPSFLLSIRDHVFELPLDL
jgi:hypothetical protein